MKKDWTTLIRQDLEDLTCVFTADRTGTGELLPGDRRSVAVLYLDLAGFTAMSERLDHELVHEICTGIMTVLSRIVSHHGGYVDKFEGDRIMALFGAEHVSENDCSRAVACSLRMLEAIRELGGVLGAEGLDLAARVGVSFGDVTVAPDPSGHLTAVGDQVNMASRMEESAEVGTVQVTEAVRRECGDQFSWVNLGAESIRWKAKPVNTWRPTGPGRKQVDRWERASRLASIPFVGRKEELAFLGSLLAVQEENAFRNRRGGAVHITAGICGDAGVGKSRLVREFLSGLESGSGDTLVVESSCISYAQPPLGPVSSLVRSALGDAASSPGGIMTGLSGILARGDGGRAGDLREDTPGCLSELLSPGGDLSGREGPKTDDEKQLMFAAVSDLFRLLAETRDRLVVLVDDAHWIDPGSRELLEFVIANCDTSRPVLFLFVYRPDPPAGSEMLDGLPDGYADRRILEITEAGEGDAREIAARLLGIGSREASGPSRAAVDFLLGTAGGNVFFLEELVLGMIESGVLERRASGGWALQPGPEGLPVPSTVTGLIRSRIDHLPETHRKVLRLASVLGTLFGTDLFKASAARVPDLPDETSRIAADLERRGFLESRADTGETGFRHTITRETVYRSILRHNRRVLHSICARTLIEMSTGDGGQVDAIACHWEDAEEAGKALAWGEKALGQAVQRTDWPTVLEWSKRLEKWVPYPPSNADDAQVLYRILMHRQRAEGVLLARREMFWTLERLTGLQNDWGSESTRADLLLAWGGYYRSTENIAESLRVFGEALDLYGRNGDIAGTGQVMMGIATSHGLTGNLTEAGEWQRRAVETFRRAGDDHRMAHALVSLANTMVRQGHLGTALPILEEVLELTRDSGDRQLEASALSSKALVLKGTGRTEEALELTRRCLDIDRATGNRSGEITDLNNICTLLRNLERIEESRSYGIQSLEACREAGDRRLEGNVLCSLAILERLEGRPDRALEYYHRSLEKHRAVGNSSGEAIVLGNIANALMDLNRVEEAIDNYRKSAEVHRRVGSVRILSEVTGYLAVNLMDLDRPGEAEAFAAESRQAARDTDDWLGLMLSDLAYAIAAEKDGDTGEALDLYRSVYHRATETSQHPESIRALIGLGRIRLVMGDLEESRKHLLGALSMSGQTRVQSVHLEHLIHYSLAELSLAAGDRRRALDACGKALEYAAATGRKELENRARELLEECRALPE